MNWSCPNCVTFSVHRELEFWFFQFLDGHFTFVLPAMALAST